jgi:Ribbon-helix-helix protein, copG family
MKPITSKGRPVTDGQIQALADEAEAGVDITKLKRAGRPTLGTAPADVFPVRLDPNLRAALEQRAETEHTTASDIVRTALRTYLHVA